jgi:anti-sigma factor RsiW
MTALSRKMLEHEPSEIRLLLPWYAAGSLNARDMKRVEDALATDPELAREYAAIQQECAATVALNESLAVPTLRSMQTLFAVIDAESSQAAGRSHGSDAGIPGFFAGLSPRALAWTAASGLLLALVQAGTIGVLLMQKPAARIQTAPPALKVRFAPDARVSEVTALLDGYNAAIIDGARDGVFTLQFAGQLSKATSDDLTARLQRETIISSAVAAP